MIRRILKSWFINLLSCFVLIAATIPPCDCIAEDAGLKKHNEKSSHSCCDEKKAGGSQQHNMCNNCDACVTGSNIFFEVEQKAAARDLLQLDTTQLAKFLFVFWLPNKFETVNTIVYKIGPPGIQVTSSATLVTILQRWLI